MTQPRLQPQNPLLRASQHVSSEATPARRNGSLGATSPAVTVLETVNYAGHLAGCVGGAYHGYKRNNSIGWAIAWSLLGTLFWPIVLPVAYAQGFGEKKKK